jgi:hypothetical protein
MIPDRIVKFLKEDATIAIGGTRNKDLIPHIHRVSGWRVAQDQQTIICSIPEKFTRDLVSSLENNGQFALTVEHIDSHETYQFKGDYVDSGLPNEVDIQNFILSRERFGDAVSRLFGLPEDVCQAFVMKPFIVISFKVREIFVQTPGPGAGRRIVPRGDD